jgi:quercetin 2,3-dioxygenase
MQIVKSGSRGHADHGWLKSYHTFSFADYHDPNRMGFGPLRVLNEDFVAAGAGFGKHPHRDMEIITYIIDGELEHQDSMGNKAVIRPGEVQHMSAGTGVMHSEYNPSDKDAVHLYQIWIRPLEIGIMPGYGQKSFDKDLNAKDIVLVASRDGHDGSIAINQNSEIYVSRLSGDKEITFLVKENGKVWVQVAKGKAAINGEGLTAGDAVAIDHKTELNIKAIGAAELIIFDLK